jgi:hypothetical protein
MSRIVPGRISLLEFGDGEGLGLNATDLEEMKRALLHETVSCIYKLDPASLRSNRILNRSRIKIYNRNLEGASSCAECIEAVRKFFTVCDLEKWARPFPPPFFSPLPLQLWSAAAPPERNSSSLHHFVSSDTLPPLSAALHPSEVMTTQSLNPKP